MKKGIIQISVLDSGKGINGKNKLKVFEPFYQADKNLDRKEGGTGLGLALSKGIIESQGGKIWVESSGKGSKFYFTVPLKPAREGKKIKSLFKG